VRWLTPIFCAVLTGSLAVAIPPAGSQQKQQPDTISLNEAEILIYLMPRADEVRSRGCDVSWEVEESSSDNQVDYYTFWVVHTGESTRCRTWATTVSYFAVNRHTADVRDVSLDDYPLQHSQRLERVQQAMRRVHAIDKETIQKYRYASPEAGGSLLAPTPPS
jgi:hypothetical protein